MIVEISCRRYLLRHFVLLILKISEIAMSFVHFRKILSREDLSHLNFSPKVSLKKCLSHHLFLFLLTFDDDVAISGKKHEMVIIIGEHD